MKKIPCLFQRDFSVRPVKLLRDVTPGCEWVLAGEGIATRKLDGAACAIIQGELYARYDAKSGRVAPAGSIPCEPLPDPITGHWPHWVRAERGRDKWILEAAANASGALPDGTYEAVGPRINGNPERRSRHTLEPHGAIHLPELTQWLEFYGAFDGIREFLQSDRIEGIVFHHPDGRMAKIRSADFGLSWPLLWPDGAEH